MVQGGSVVITRLSRFGLPRLILIIRMVATKSIVDIVCPSCKL